jgi:hypothetical protein
VEERLAALDRDGFSRRLWSRDASLWKGAPAVQRAIERRLGWLTAAGTMVEEAHQLTSFAQEVRAAGYRQAVLLGMGGSSLAPQVFHNTFGVAPDHLELKALDTTDPASILAVERSIDLPKTLFIASSKSGVTTETVSLFHYFFQRMLTVKGKDAGASFLAITDPGTPLEGTAQETLVGVHVAGLLARVEAMRRFCLPDVPLRDNPGVTLGAILGEMTTAGRDKVTLVASPPIASFNTWVEQMLAESLGKEGRGLVPVEGEPLDEPRAYGKDRLFVCLRLDSADNAELDRRVEALATAGQPVVRLHLTDAYDLGQEIFCWEVATAVAGAILNVNPFDEPNVQEAKDNTTRLLMGYVASGRWPQDSPVAEGRGLSLFCDAATTACLRAGGASLTDLLAGHLRSLQPGDYLALLAYLTPTEEHHRALQEIRLRLGRALRFTTTLGYGPRYLHSTGQLHKGGPNTGVFLQLTAEDGLELPIPGQKYGFSALKRAQALGDLRSLQTKGRRVLHIHLGTDVAAGLESLQRLVEEALD